MSEYDPFERGPHPVGVRSVDWKDAARDRTLPVEVWYPATETHRGQDLDEATCDHYKPLPFAPEVAQEAVRDAAASAGARPAIVFSHGFGGERRQTTFLCTHWASHGYVVAAMDHVGNTTADMMSLATAGSSVDPVEMMTSFVTDRPLDATFVIDRLLAGDASLEVDPGRIGMSGHSFGGWTTLETTGRDARIRAALPLAPAGGRSQAEVAGPTDEIAAQLHLDWGREVPTLFLVAELDTLLPLDGMRDLHARTPEPRLGVNLRNADHFHFCDRVEQVHDLFKTMGPMIAGGLIEGAPDAQGMLAKMKPSSELCPGEHAYQLVRGLGLAHMDAHVNGDARAIALLRQDLRALMAERGVAVDLL